MANQAQILPGTLDLLILRAVSLGPLHGYGILLRIGQMSGNALLIEQGALYPGLFRLVAYAALDIEITGAGEHQVPVAIVPLAGEDKLAPGISAIVSADLARTGLFRLVGKGLLKATWGTSDNNRRAKFYELTAAGRKRLREETDNWNRLVTAIGSALSVQPEEL